MTYPLGFEGMDATPTAYEMIKEITEVEDNKRQIERDDAEVARVNKLMSPGMVAKMQDYARACIKKNPKATPARIGRMVAKKFKLKLTHDKRTTGRR
jgi:hypothetical protein